MTNASKHGLDAAGFLGSIPSRAGMTSMASRIVLEQMAAGASVVVFDKGYSTESFAHAIHQPVVDEAKHVVRVGGQKKDKPVAHEKAEPYYRQFEKR